MDRFIELDFYYIFCLFIYLKSNMDRFIANDPKPTCTTQCYLKSNMDRFIEMMFQCDKEVNKI